MKHLLHARVKVLELELEGRRLALNFDFEEKLGRLAQIKSGEKQLVFLDDERHSWRRLDLSFIKLNEFVELVLLAEQLIGLMDDLLHLLARILYHSEVGIRPLRRHHTLLFILLASFSVRTHLLVHPCDQVLAPIIVAFGQFRQASESVFKAVHC